MKRLTLLLAVAAALLHAATGVAFLKIPVDARVCAVGEAGAVHADNPSALFYNPAGLAGVRSFGLVAMHNEWLLGMNHEYVAASYGAENLGTFGMSFNYWSSGAIQGITFRGDTIPGYTFSVSDWCLSLGYGREIGPFCLGLGAKFVSEQNESLATSAWAFDAGASYRTPVPGLRFGLSAANLGTRLKLDQEEYGLPVSGRVGWRYDWRMLGVAQDFIISEAEKPGVAAGVECRIVDILALRVGYRTGSDVQGLSGLRAGLGVQYLGIGVDYAFAPYGMLGLTHRLSLTFNSGPLTRLD
jgi:opacity protein-like surface antigen